MNELTPFQIKIVQEFIKEQKIRKLLTRLSLFFSLGAGFGFLILLFKGGHLADPTLAILMYWGLFTNISSTLLIPYYAIPKLILAFQNEQAKDQVNFRLDLIQQAPENYLYPFLRDRGFRDRIDLHNITHIFLINQFQLQDRFDWRLLGKIYFAFYCLVSITCFYFFVQADF